MRHKCDEANFELAKHVQRKFEVDMEAADESNSGDESDSDFEDAEEERLGQGVVRGKIERWFP
jgi:hypothetical protein